VEKTAGALQGSTVLKFLSPADGDRAIRTLHKLAHHDISRWALTGGLAVECHARGDGVRALNDIDFIAPGFDSIPTTLAADFLFRHVHPLDPPGKTMLQIVDPETAVRIDVFRACGETMRRAVAIDCEFGRMAVVSLADLVSRQARQLLDLADGVPVPAKHAHDYLRLVESVTDAQMHAAWPDHRRPSHPEDFAEARALLRDLIAAHRDLLIDPTYSRDPGAICPRCRIVAHFPLADAHAILDLLGYC
jgi:hypothetical protein